MANIIRFGGGISKLNIFQTKTRTSTSTDVSLWLNTTIYNGNFETISNTSIYKQHTQFPYETDFIRITYNEVVNQFKFRVYSKKTTIFNNAKYEPNTLIAEWDYNKIVDYSFIFK